VGQNIEFPLKMKGVATARRRERALDLMRMVRLPESYYGKNVTKCSGGERQRVALARAFAYDPEILFFDEPLSAIDYKLRKTLEKELKDLHKETGKTFVYITHSLEEAMVMSDRIGVMRAGKLVQVGTPEDIYARPKDLFVSAFMGEVNLIPVRKNGNGTWEGLDLPAHFRAEGGAAAQGHLVVRPEQMRFLRDPAEADNALEGRLYNRVGCVEPARDAVVFRRGLDRTVLPHVPRAAESRARARGGDSHVSPERRLDGREDLRRPGGRTTDRVLQR
jgi:spermidine/putrescine transport system ATP-binding protein